MAEEKIFIPKDGEDNYIFSETSTKEVPNFNPNMDKKNIFESIKRKNFIVAFIAVIVFLTLYKIVDVLWPYFHRPSTQNSEISQEMQRKAVENRQIITKNAPFLSSPTRPVQSIKEVEINSHTGNQNIPVLSQSDQMALIKDEKVQEELARLNGQLTTLQENMDTINAQLNNINNSLQTAIIQKTKPEKKYSASRKITQKVKKLNYVIRGLIPGRAWLTDEEGKTLTVSVGDELSGYGTITVINVDEGQLETSSGAIINFSSEDR